ncbi:hypothetical protein V0R50_06535 [Pseudomonas sp. 148P]|uniref:Sel1 repeat family protein n=1 Tax=Pseudomonas ulcerans TaxID=3115852 RepID=A0ABU7HMV6_9PSED|nr:MULTISPECIES: hypothetical protein [unclassified Pseudomonas]MEE1921572.1 hypothetical protein [Pseudomonas sp. 147P]MEE1932870.1 hypothetical protein [Pseudomonas sp. 148P]
MTKKTAVVSHNGSAYDLTMGSWLQHLNSKTSIAIQEISTDDILLPDGKTAGAYKAEKKSEYKSQTNRSCSSAKQHLNERSRRDFGHDWDHLIGLIKDNINNACNRLLLAPHRLTIKEQVEVQNAALNGHIGAMYWIGTALRDQQDDACLRWLSMAHNRGQLGACHEMAIHLAAKGNYIESLRCLIISADGGSDMAYMSIFQISTLTNMFKIQEKILIESMLEELIDASHASSANYFKGMLKLFSDKQTEGISILKNFLKEPRKKPPEHDTHEVYGNQIRLVSAFIEGILNDIPSGTPLLNSISTRGKQAGFCSFADYDDFFKITKEILASG